MNLPERFHALDIRATNPGMESTHSLGRVHHDERDTSLVRSRGLVNRGLAVGATIRTARSERETRSSKWVIDAAVLLGSATHCRGRRRNQSKELTDGACPRIRRPSARRGDAATDYPRLVCAAVAEPPECGLQVTTMHPKIERGIGWSGRSARR
jgi:hypothetical protein